MPCTTYLHDSEIIAHVSNTEIRELVALINKQTLKSNPHGKDLVVNEYQLHVQYPWWRFKKSEIKFKYSIFAYVGGVGDWQVINLPKEGCYDFYSENTVITYLYGVINGMNRQERLRNDK